MKIQRSELLILPVVALLSGCSFVARDADGYREVRGWLRQTGVSDLLTLLEIGGFPRGCRCLWEA